MKNIAKSLQFLKDSLVRLLDGEFPLEELIISKSCGFYKDPDKIAHIDRMGKRDPGNKPQSNDRGPMCILKLHRFQKEHRSYRV